MIVPAIKNVTEGTTKIYHGHAPRAGIFEKETEEVQLWFTVVGSSQLPWSLKLRTRKWG